MKSITAALIKPIFIVVLVFSATLLYTSTGQAVEFVDGNTIEAGEVINDDVFISGETVVIAGTVNGDLFAAGANVLVNGVVNGSLFVGAQSASINGSVSGSLYFAGSSLDLDSETQIGRNLYFAGFALQTQPGSSIGRDLLLGGYQAILAGVVGRDLQAGAVALELNGKVEGDVNVAVGKTGTINVGPLFLPPGAPAMVNPGLRIGEDAQIGGKLTYTSQEEQSGAILSIPGAGVVYQTPIPSEGVQGGRTPKTDIELRIGRWILARMREFVTLLVLGGLAIWLLPVMLGRWSERLAREPLPAAAWGLISVLLGYAGAVVLGLLIFSLGLILGVITLGGLARSIFGVGLSGLGLVFAVFTFLVSYGSKLIVAFLVGTIVIRQIAPQALGKPIWSMLVGILIYIFLRSIPLVGWIFGLLATLLGFGAIFLVLRDNFPMRVPIGATQT